MYKAPRGTFDIFENQYLLRKSIVETMFLVVGKYGFLPIETPMFEESQLFKRSVGESSDIVNKEIYEFNDKKGRQLALRPELTAPIMRAYIENKMYAQDPQRRFCYYGPSFRYERPQAGRFRQFNQFGVESMGIKNPIYDAQMIAMAISILQHLNITDFSLKINTIGSAKNREVYNQELQKYLHAYKQNLCADCQTRIKQNPLRILDCKSCSLKLFIKQAPKLINFIDDDAINYYQQIKKALDQLNINYEEDHSLVRGLDYYNDIVFEIISNSNNAKNTLIGGGRYDGLSSQLSEHEVSSIGFAIGIERIIDEIIKNNPQIEKDFDPKLDIYFSCQNDQQRLKALKIMQLLRNGLNVDLNWQEKSYKANLKHALKMDALILMSFNENNDVVIRNLATKTEEVISISQLIDQINNYVND